MIRACVLIAVALVSVDATAQVDYCKGGKTCRASQIRATGNPTVTSTTSSAPQYVFTPNGSQADPLTGLGYYGAGSVGLYSSGTRSFRWGTNGILYGTSDIWTFGANNTSGLYMTNSTTADGVTVDSTGVTIRGDATGTFVKVRGFVTNVNGREPLRLYSDGGVRLMPQQNGTYSCPSDGGAQGTLFYDGTYDSIYACGAGISGLGYQLWGSFGGPQYLFQSRTIASGVITTGNLLLGTTRFPGGYFPNRDAGVPMWSVNDRIVVQCNTAGTGAGSYTVALRDQTNSVDVCTVSLACATASLTPVSNSCGGQLPLSLTTTFGTTINVSGCTTAPADCVVTHAITQQ